jgi:hypothetical protein
VLSFSYEPFFIKNLYLGFNRVFHTYSPKNSSDFKKDYLLVLNSLFRNQYRDDNSPIDQLLSVYSKFIFPKNLKTRKCPESLGVSFLFRILQTSRTKYR